MTTITNDPCIYCGDPTAFGSTHEDGSLVGKFVNRIPADTEDEETGEYKDGYACAECAGYGCDECETRVDFQDESGKYHYGNFHSECYNEAKHGKAEYGENIEETL